MELTEAKMYERSLQLLNKKDKNLCAVNQDGSLSVVYISAYDSIVTGDRVRESLETPAAIKLPAQHRIRSEQEGGEI